MSRATSPVMSPSQAWTPRDSITDQLSNVSCRTQLMLGITLLSDGTLIPIQAVLLQKDACLQPALRRLNECSMMIVSVITLWDPIYLWKDIRRSSKPSCARTTWLLVTASSEIHVPSHMGMIRYRLKPMFPGIIRQKYANSSTSKVYVTMALAASSYTEGTRNKLEKWLSLKCSQKIQSKLRSGFWQKVTLD